MKGVLAVDPNIYELGAATGAVRALFSQYADIDWFVPPSVDADDARAAFMRHHELARHHEPELFAEEVSIEVWGGGWPEFAARCERVRPPYETWSWKFEALKQLKARHSEAHGWVASAAPGDSSPSPDKLFFAVGDATIWNVQFPRLDMTGVERQRAELIRFYKSYCDVDMLEAIEWQLAEPSCLLADNPLAALLRVYEAGYYPFHLTPERVELFFFASFVQA